jgi:hypothetical protein
MITEEKYRMAAALLVCDVAAIKAVGTVESSGSGFLKSGKLVIKFEGHQFHKLTKGKYDKSHPHLSYPKWTEKYSAFGEASYNRFNEAFKLDPKAAMLATSFGRFQIMGFNHSSCGFKSVGEFVDFLKVDEGNHLIAFAMYVKSVRLDDELRAKNWDAFAKAYNGPLYQKNDYAGKLGRAYAQFLKHAA